MSDNIGIILLDDNEIILRIYRTENNHWWKLLRSQTYDLASGIPGRHCTASEFIEFIANILLKQTHSHIGDWKICARNIEERIIIDIKTATGLPTELLTLEREQELLCQGALMELE